MPSAIARRHGATTDDVGALAQLSAVAAAAFMPIVLSLDPRALEVDAFSDLEGVRDVTAPMRGPDHLRWRGLAGRADMRFVAVTLPRLLARHPWTDEPSRVDGFRYSEHAPDADTRVWMSAGYAFAACAVRAFVDNNWPADVRGVEIDRVGGGLVTNLAAEPFISGPPYVWPRRAIEYQFSYRQEHALVEVGMMPIGALPFGPEMVFGASRSMQAPASYSGATAAAADANARLSAQINSMLCAARFAHLLKVMGRDMVGSFRTADEIERQLNRWLQDYVNTNINSTSELRARFPLVEGNVQVRERPGKPGVVRLHDPSAAALPARRRRHRLPPCDRTRGTRRLTIEEDRCHLRPQAAAGEAGRLFREGNLADALTAANAAVRKTPTDIGARVLLAELLVFAGNIERADVILDACADLDPTAAVVVAEFRQLLRGETARRQLFSDGRVPEFLGEPTAAQRLSLAAVVALRDGDSQEAGKLAAQAEEVRGHADRHRARRGRSTTCATPTTCWPRVSRSSPRPASISGSRRSG